MSFPSLKLSPIRKYLNCEKTYTFLFEMGVKIRDLFKEEQISFKDLKDRVIVVDAYNVLHQFLASIRGRDGSPLKNSRGEITSHLTGLFHRTANMVEAKIRPVYAFDGKPHPLKAKTLQERKERKELAEKEYKEAIEAGDLKKARSKAQQTGRLTDKMIDQTKELLEALGIPYVQAPSEGEFQASYMVKKGHAFAVGSQDYDCLLVGSPVLIRNLTSQGRRKLPGKEAYTPIYPKQIRLKTNLKSLGITQKQLVDMAILIGTDYNDGIKGIGPKKSLNLIKNNGNAEKALATLEAENAPSLKEIEEIRKIFLKPNVTDDYTLDWLGLDTEKTLKILIDEHHFKQERVEPVLEKFGNISHMAKQKTLF
jgi:flap endonuclease-1